MGKRDDLNPLAWKPEQLWESWQASDEQSWDPRRIAHWLRRVSFGGSAADIAEATRLGFDKSVDLWCGKIDGAGSEAASGSEGRQTGDHQSDQMVKSVRASEKVLSQSAWWLHRMRVTSEPFREKMTLFWHGHFATSAEKVKDGTLMFDQNQLLREHAIGSFPALVHQIAKDPAMLIYLDSATNRKAHANENFARELMELFCLGEGHYSEADVQELARCFTGWEIRRGRFRFNPYQHDQKPKRLLGSETIESGEEAIDHLLKQKRVEYFLVRKWVHFFICDQTEWTDDQLEPLASQLRHDQLAMLPTLRRIVTSRLMMHPWCEGRKIRSPVELTMGFLKALDAMTSWDWIAQQVRQVGQGLFEPPNVEGWEGGRSWINSATLLGRANLIEGLVTDPRTRIDGQPLASLLEPRSARSGSLMQSLLNSFVPQTLHAKLLSRFPLESTSDHSALQRVCQWATHPVFQLQ
jgi:uncharacterized protein (DUF1800 family)